MAVTMSVPDIRRIVLAGTVGNAMEWYDFSLYGTLAPVLAKLFFPAADPTASLLATFAAFAAGFAARPLGGAVFGHFGDRYGRKNTLAASVILMAVPSTVIGLLPTYAHVGLTAPVLLVLARVLQGISAGGELTGSTSFLLEQAPAGHRGLLASLAVSGATVGNILGSVIGALLTSALPPEAFEAWGWRVPFLLGMGVGLAGLYVRLGLPETPAFVKTREAGEIAHEPCVEAIRHFPRQIATLVGVQCAPAITAYVLIGYMPTYLSRVVGLPLSAALTIMTVGLVVMGLVGPAAGALSDRVGRKPIIMGWAIGCLVLSYPLFALISRGPEGTAFVGVLLYAGLVSLHSPVFALMPESVPTRVRCSAHSIGYNIGSAVFGGTTPVVATALIAVTHNQLAPSLYIMFAAIVTLFAVSRVRDRYREPLT
jgi:MHS family proline/betaine transporter-like MFS transporter